NQREAPLTPALAHHESSLLLCSNSSSAGPDENFRPELCRQSTTMYPSQISRQTQSGRRHIKRQAIVERASIALLSEPTKDPFLARKLYIPFQSCLTMRD